ncbi:MAG: hypothetical protein KGQ36_07480 [Rickettsiales bacterium]|nr:hypothetical protein [Rickettsiales bacterium]
MKKFLLKISLIFLILFHVSSCELTRKLWEDYYVEQVKQFLVSNDGSYLVLIGDEYHYVFNDASGIMKQLLNLDRDKIILLNSKKSELMVERDNYVEGNIIFETYDPQLTPEQYNLLASLGFRRSEEDAVLFTKIKIIGKRYQGNENINSFLSVSGDFNEIKVKRLQTAGREFEKILLTPITIVGDSLMIFKFIALTSVQD